MLSVGPTTKVYLRPGATDLRLGYEGLSQLVRTVLRQEPQSGHVFAFCNHSRTRLKLLLHDGSGLWLCSKRLDSGGFTWPARRSGRSADGSAVVGADCRIGSERMEEALEALNIFHK